MSEDTNHIEVLHAAAKRLRLGVEGPKIADELDKLAAALSTPRAAEVSDAKVRIALAAYAKEHAEHDDRLPACVRTMNCMRAALTAALTPPSAEGENK